MRKWNDWESEYLKGNYQKIKNIIISNKLDRSIKSIEKKADRMGISRKRIGIGGKYNKINLDENDIEYIKKNYPLKTILTLSNELNKSYSKIYSLIRYLGIKKVIGSWNKNKKGHIPYSKNKIGELSPFYGRKHKLETIQKMKDAHKGYTPTKETINKLRETHKRLFMEGKSIPPMLNKHHTEDAKQKIRLALLRTIKSGKMNLRPNNKEKILDKFLQKNYPNEWKYVGDGQVIVKNLIPDFINVNGKKLIIELNGDYWHNLPNSKEKDEKKIRTYEEFGYKTLVIWEHQLKDITKLDNEIKKFCEVQKW